MLNIITIQTWNKMYVNQCQYDIEDSLIFHKYRNSVALTMTIQSTENHHHTKSFFSLDKASSVICILGKIKCFLTSHTSLSQAMCIKINIINVYYQQKIYTDTYNKLWNDTQLNEKCVIHACDTFTIALFKQA